MRVLTWNVNGIKAAVRRCGGLQRLLDSINAGPLRASYRLHAFAEVAPSLADIICLQETKVKSGDLERELAIVDGW